MMHEAPAYPGSNLWPPAYNTYTHHSTTTHYPPSGPGAYVPSSSTPAPAPPEPRKRGRPPGPKRVTSKRSRKQATEAGVGPSAGPTTPPILDEPGLVEAAAPSIPALFAEVHSERPKKPSSELTGGCDCWALVAGTEHKDEPAEAIKAAARLAALAHLKASPSTLRRPDGKIYPRLLCILCLAHVRKLDDASPIIIGGPAELESRGLETISEEITSEGIARYIAELVAEQDLPFNIVHAPTFRRLLCYVGQSNITARDIPERRVIRQAASELSRQEKEQIKYNLRKITGHYEKKVDGKDILVVDLLAFRMVEGVHTGINLGSILFGILSEYQILGKIGTIMLDNASNNNTMMEQLEALMWEAGYIFDKEGSRVRCFPHIVNLAVVAFLDALDRSGVEYYQHQVAQNHNPSQNTNKYLEALQNRPDIRCREIVKALKPGQRKQAFQQLIKEGNEQGFWQIDQEEVEKVMRNGTYVDEVRTVKVAVHLAVRNLLLDVRTRWSSTRNMIKRFLELYPAISRYIEDNQYLLGRFVFSPREFVVLKHILDVLDVAHRAQELLSAEQTPTLALAFPVYNKMLRDWRDLGKRYGALAYAINAARMKIQDYMKESKKSPIHILAMFLNPCIKYTFIDQNWSDEEKVDAREVVKRFMMKYAESRDQQAEAAGKFESSSECLATKSSSALGQGVSNLFEQPKGLSHSLGSSINMGEITPPCSPTPGTSSVFPTTTPARASGTIPTGEPAMSPLRAAIERREHAVALEHDAYLAAPLRPLEQLGKIDMVNHWSTQSTLPVLQAMSRDVLPVQASSVSSERVFSSSKRTCTLARNKLGADTVEMLQILKNSLRQRHRVIQARSKASAPSNLNDGQSDETDGLLESDLMNSLGDYDWDDDAILDTDGDAHC
ncbi:unnamed protein product [Rhizoctonia solani]|uniref:HAT C-terminal dimerisation domain-containing protein n=1 Tax=Rhizoctonia solani TaxID=456999 RepID=A0A8H3DVB3_9AGAM|nr:unnamed protein product [Rhizoctonia solani]